MDRCRCRIKNPQVFRMRQWHLMPLRIHEPEFELCNETIWFRAHEALLRCATVALNCFYVNVAAVATANISWRVCNESRAFVHTKLGFVVRQRHLMPLRIDEPQFDVCDSGMNTVPSRCFKTVSLRNVPTVPARVVKIHRPHATCV